MHSYLVMLPDSEDQVLNTVLVDILFIFGMLIKTSGFGIA